MSKEEGCWLPPPPRHALPKLCVRQFHFESNAARFSELRWSEQFDVGTKNQALTCSLCVMQYSVYLSPAKVFIHKFKFLLNGSYCPICFLYSGYCSKFIYKTNPKIEAICKLFYQVPRPYPGRKTTATANVTVRVPGTGYCNTIF